MNKIKFFFYKKHIFILFPCILLMIEYLIQVNIVDKQFKKKNKHEKEFFISVSHYLAEALILITNKFYYKKKKLKVGIKSIQNTKFLYIRKNIFNSSYKHFPLFLFVISLIEIFLSIFKNNNIIIPISNAKEKKSFNYLEIKCCLCCIFYILFFKLNFYNFQYLSISTFMITSIFKIFYNFFEKENNKKIKVLIDFLYFFIREFLYILRIILIKYVNHYYYVNIFLAIGFEGILNLFFHTIYYFFSYNIYNNENLFKLLNMKLIISLLIILIIYFCFYLVFCLMILKFDPIIYCLSILLFDFLKFFYNDIILDLHNDNKICDLTIKIIKTIFTVFHCLAILIFCQIMQLNFYGLNKNTNVNIELREDEEISQIAINN